jgi:calcineurin-like phosphoesterase family protein
MWMIQKLVAQGYHWCHRCKSHNIKFAQIKWKDYQAILVKFPQKKVVETEKSIEQLLKMEGEWVSNPYPTDPDLKEEL